MPWSAPTGGPQYFDLRRHPELVSQLPEASASPELKEFLNTINSEQSFFESAKCDLWWTTELSVEDEVFCASGKFGGYIDLLFALTRGEDARRSFARHEELAEEIVRLLRRAPETRASAEFLLRRCYYRQDDEDGAGFYFTAYVFGFGDFEEQARSRWAVALKLAQDAILQISLAGRD